MNKKRYSEYFGGYQEVLIFICGNPNHRGLIECTYDSSIDELISKHLNTSLRIWRQYE